ncbi:cytochrome P450 4c21-like [Chrysoperla carnea]|uniref:cytochrome P450 4c21-like n=1 Tax=Chrysoperla carnea TaxID=189513 RepID=UPI001D0781B6|nr:cytochrome P450 4c21-like [Chrysoperla carnea]
MMSISLILSFITNSVLVRLIISIIILLCVYFSNYFRMCYYVLKIPGPPAYPVIGNGLLLRGSHEEISNVMVKIFTKYNQLCRLWLGPVPIVIVSEPKIIQEVLNNQNALEKGWIMKLITKIIARNSLIIARVPQWKRSRNIIVKGFTVPILKSYFNAILSKTTLDSVCASSMGVDINSHEGDSSYFEALHRSFDIMIRRLFNPLIYPDMIYKLTQDYKQAMEYKDIVWSVARKVISEKRNKYNNENINNNLMDFKAAIKNTYKKPLLDYMMDFTRNNPDFTDAQFEADINFIIMAGFETVSKSISMVLLLLALHKDEQKKVCDELFEVLNNRNKIDFIDLPNFKYMEMVIKETMRLFPPVPIIARQLADDIDIESYRIPKGINIGFPIFCVHRNEKYWKNPLKFNPNRFSPENIKNHHPYAFIPFGGGPRNCIGDRYTWIFMKLTLASLLSRYEFHTDIKDLSEIRYELEITIKIIGGYQVRVTPR